MKRFVLALVGLAVQAQTLVVVSVDGLDHRYLRDADKLGAKIPVMRRLIAEGAWADGVVGVMPSVTFPSHTTIVTGKRPFEHGIISNSNGADLRYWYASQIKAPVIWDAARKAGIKVGAVDWPATVGADIALNFPEKFKSGGAGRMEMSAHREVSTPGLIEKISARYPSFARAVVDDRARTLAVQYMLEVEKARLILVHLVDHDADAHEFAPYTPESLATLEYADECIGAILRVLPSDGVLALVSDHGFERVERLVDPRQYSNGELTVSSTYLHTGDAAVAAALRGKDGIGREVPQNEIVVQMPEWAGRFVFEPSLHVNFGTGTLKAVRGSHGYWPLRDDYRAVFALWGKGIKAERLSSLQMTDIAGRLARVLRLQFP